LYALRLCLSCCYVIPRSTPFAQTHPLLQLANNSHTTLDLLGATIADGMTAVTIILAMSFGVIVPKIAIDRLTDSATRLKA